jgi:hypothetical protein
MVPGESKVQVVQSQFLFSSLATSMDQGTNNPFNVYISVPGHSTQRAAASTPVTLVSNNTAVLSDPADVTIVNNASYASASTTGVGAGSTTLTASSPGSGIDAVGSATVTVYGFTIPSGQQNLSRLAGATASASTIYSSGYPAAKAIDGIFTSNSSWCTANNDPAPKITVTLPSDVTVSSIQIATSWSPSYDFKTGSFKMYKADNTEIYNSGVVSLTNGAINHPVSGGPLSLVRKVEFSGATWNSIEPCLSELAVVGTNP